MLMDAENIFKKFRSGDGYLEVLKGASLTLEPKSLAILSGPSGSGKSTLLYVLGGLERPDSGTVNFKGNSVWNYSSDLLNGFRNKDIGFVFQMHYLMPDFTTLENVMIPAMIYNMPRKQALERAQSLLSELSIYERKDHYPNQLSGGEQQRTAVARALINSPELVLADEPTGNLDRENTDSLLKLFHKLVETTGVSVLIATHDETVSEMGQAKFRLTRGKIES
ncbi:MAG: ABC transporter ATP-binding protein [candidate division Zixibacteria bacterium]